MSDLCTSHDHCYRHRQHVLSLMHGNLQVLDNPLTPSPHLNEVSYRTRHCFHTVDYVKKYIYITRSLPENQCYSPPRHARYYTCMLCHNIELHVGKPSYASRKTALGSRYNDLQPHISFNAPDLLSRPASR